MATEDPTRPIRLLLVEDNPGDADLVREHLFDLREGPVELDVVMTLKDGLERLREAAPPYSAVLLDLNLPDASGLPTVDEVVSHSAAVPVIVLTGAGGDELGLEAVARGAVDFLPKEEVSGRLLLRSVRYAIERGRRHRVEARYRALVENSRDLVTILDRDLSIAYVSPSLTPLLGYRPEEKTGEDAWLEVHPEDRPSVERELTMLTEDPSYVSHLEYRVRHEDGSWRVLDTVAQNCFDDPQIRGFVLNSRDVTDLREVEETATRTARRLERTLGALEDAVLAFEGADLEIAACNRAAESIFGYPPHELVGRSARMLYPDRAVHHEVVVRSDAVLRRGEPYRAEHRMRRRDGAEFPAEITLTLLDPPRGMAGGVVQVVRDVSERVEQARRVRFQAALLDQVGQPVIATDRDGNVTYWNRAAEAITGWTREEVEGRPILDLIVVEGDRDRALAARRTVMSGESWQGELRLQRRHGSTALVQATVTPGVQPDGSAGGRIAAGIDITERRALEAQLRQAQKMEAIGRLAGGVAHDFNNVLTVIEGHASLLLEELAEDPSLRRDVEEIIAAGRRASGLTRRLLAFSRRQVLEERNLDFGRVALDLETMLERLVPERIDFRVETPQGELVVRADPGQLQQVVMNLVLNAVDAIPGSGWISMRIDVLELSPDEANALPWKAEAGPYARLTVRDSGVGIPAEVLDRIFEPFFTTKPEGHGTGLGLATVYGIVKQSGGHILVDSTVDEGTTFQVLLPRLEQAADPGPAAPTEVPAAGSEVVLLVEDEKPVRDIARKILERAGYTVLEAATGHEALELATGRDAVIDLVVSDVVMPDLGGVELQKRLAEARPELKIVLTSGYSEMEVQAEIRQQGSAFLPKPFTPDDLLRCVGRALGRADPPG